MPITAKCIIEHGMIKLPPSLGLIDGTKVLVNIEPLLHKSSNKAIARELAGSWGADDSIDLVFADIAAQRHSYYGRV
jgi:hypothetical protein